MITAGIYSTDRRIFPERNLISSPSLTLDSARNEVRSCQVFLKHSGGDEKIICRLSADASSEIEVRFRRVGFVPVQHYNTETPESELDHGGRLPGFIPDPLFDESEVEMAPGGNGLFWITLTTSSNAAPGTETIIFRVYDGSAEQELRLFLQVSELVLGDREGLSVTHWFYSDALLDWYRIEAFEERYWRIAAAYMENLISHGIDVLYVPLFSPVTDGDRRPAQLLEVGDGDTFQWKDVSKYLRIAKKLGFKKFEWPHLFSQWGASGAIVVYRGQGTGEVPLWQKGLPGKSERYRDFLSRFLPELKSFLVKEQVLEGSFFHVSDEPHGEEHRKNYIESRNMLKDIAPWMKTMDAVSEIEYGREGLTDIPIPLIATVSDYIKEEISCFTYFCCHPRGYYINRHLDTPLHKIRMLGWVLYRHRRTISGFLHWGYNYWYRSQTRELIDPFTISDGGAWPSWAYGDTFVVYPGKSGPIDSIRWEIFAEGLQDYRLLQSAGIDPEDDLLSGIIDFKSFPRSPEWRTAVRRELLLLK